VTILATVIAALLAAAITYPLGRAHTSRRAPGVWKGPAQPAPGPEQTAAQAVPWVTVQLVNRDGRTWVEAVAEISDGHVTARGTHEAATSYWDREYGTRTCSTQATSQSAAQSAIKEASRLLAGAQAGYAAEATAHATRAAEAERAVTAERATAEAGA
jgi:hypothetical protein